MDFDVASVPACAHHPIPLLLLVLPSSSSPFVHPLSGRRWPWPIHGAPTYLRTSGPQEPTYLRSLPTSGTSGAYLPQEVLAVGPLLLVQRL
eukprot:4637198-Pyramimonas_sp.AAC.1